MKCPVCNDVRLREVQKDDVMIDICPECKGVWLDRGELEKLMQEVREVRPAFNEWYDKHEDDRKYYRNDEDYRPSGRETEYGKRYPHHGQGYYKKKKKKSVLDVFGDLFD
ncbi:zf-TFIIB domain-containing protein [Paenibacillus faecalis]|uniref:TFIIB-type zinc ribbon-containing protein n=1 Tax=Paenibacillus faecalis TaxID=2079532 RepID=UPI000D0EC9A7|nr:zf-TFIIB domain-containing protein [Paenibacillus faecalis]